MNIYTSTSIRWFLTREGAGLFTMNKPVNLLIQVHCSYKLWHYKLNIFCDVKLALFFHADMLQLVAL